MKSLHFESTSQESNRLAVGMTCEPETPEVALSCVVNKFRRLGAQVIRTEELFDRAIKMGTTAHEDILDVWPDSMLDDGSIDKDSLKALLLKNPHDADELKFIVEPEIERLREEEIAKAEGPYAIEQSSRPIEEVSQDQAYERVLWVARKADSVELLADHAAPIDTINIPVGPEQLLKIDIFHALYEEIARRKERQTATFTNSEGVVSKYSVI